MPARKTHPQGVQSSLGGCFLKKHGQCGPGGCGDRRQDGPSPLTPLAHWFRRSHRPLGGGEVLWIQKQRTGWGVRFSKQLVSGARQPGSEPAPEQSTVCAHGLRPLGVGRSWARVAVRSGSGARETWRKASRGTGSDSQCRGGSGDGGEFRTRVGPATLALPPGGARRGRRGAPGA